MKSRQQLIDNALEALDELVKPKNGEIKQHFNEELGIATYKSQIRTQLLGNAPEIKSLLTTHLNLMADSVIEGEEEKI